MHPNRIECIFMFSTLRRCSAMNPVKQIMKNLMYALSMIVEQIDRDLIPKYRVIWFATGNSRACWIQLKRAENLKTNKFIFQTKIECFLCAAFWLLQPSSLRTESSSLQFIYISSDVEVVKLIASHDETDVAKRMRMWRHIVTTVPFSEWLVQPFKWNTMQFYF